MNPAMVRGASEVDLVPGATTMGNVVVAVVQYERDVALRMPPRCSFIMVCWLALQLVRERSAGRTG